MHQLIKLIIVIVIFLFIDSMGVVAVLAPGNDISISPRTVPMPGNDIPYAGYPATITVPVSVSQINDTSGIPSDSLNQNGSSGIVAAYKPGIEVVMTTPTGTSDTNAMAKMVYPDTISSSATASAISATPYKTPTTFVHYVTRQSLEPGGNVPIIVCLRTGATGCPSQDFELWSKTDNGGWVITCAGTTGTGSNAGRTEGVIWNNYPDAHTIQFRVYYPGNSQLASATSNIVAIKFESTKTKPYLTTLYAYAPKQVIAKGTSAVINVRLMSGNTPLSGKKIYVWKSEKGKWKLSGMIVSGTGTRAGWAQTKNKLTKAGTGLYQFTFNRTLPYESSTSNSVQLIWK